MSRSYRKYPVIRQETEDFRALNRKIRHDKDWESFSRGDYKRHAPRDDWHYRWSMDDAIKDWSNNNYGVRQRFDSLEDWLAYWEKSTKRK